MNVTFTGTEDASVCPDCVFNFDITATTGDEVGTDCYFAGPYWQPVAFDGSDTCLDARADDSFECAFPPPDGFSCPALAFEGDGNPVTLIVYGFTDCGSDGIGAYDLQINNGDEGGSGAVLLHDNVLLSTPVSFADVITVSGSATIAE